MIDLGDLGLDPHTIDTGVEAVTPQARPDPGKPAPLAPGSPLAQAIYQLWSGTPITICNSLPGAGKSTLIASAVNYLLKRSPLSITVATPTRRGAAELAGRIAVECGADHPDSKVRIALGVKGVTMPPGVRGSTASADVTVRTIASCAFGQPTTDILIIDEAYQATFADVAAAADRVSQVLLVGDPGQIGPVITANTSAWRRARIAPHMRAPEAFAKQPGAVTIALAGSYRLGPRSLAAIACLYDFEATSLRGDRHITGPDGKQLGEIMAHRIDPAPSSSDLTHHRFAAQLAASYVGSTLHVTTPAGEHLAETITPKDVCVVVSHNVQSSSVKALLDAPGLGQVTVGTADRLQGGQWHVTVAIDPLIGHSAAGSHQLSPGRLCVMATRHMTHLAWVHDGEWADRLAEVADSPADAAVGLQVRKALTGGATPGKVEY